LKEVIPGLTRVALLGDAGAAPGLYQTLEDAARDLGLVARAFKVARGLNPDFDGALEAAKKESVDAVVVLSTRSQHLIETDRKQQARLPTCLRDHGRESDAMALVRRITPEGRRIRGQDSQRCVGDLPWDSQKPELIINSGQRGTRFAHAVPHQGDASCW
jgi:hypothetical protein